MLIDGVFHADPHPGNLLMRESGDIVLLDYGQTKELPPETIVFVSQMVDMLAEGDSETIIEAMDAAGMKMTDGIPADVMEVVNSHVSNIFAIQISPHEETQSVTKRTSCPSLVHIQTHRPSPF